MPIFATLALTVLSAYAQDAAPGPAAQSCAAFADQYFARRGYQSVEHAVRGASRKATHTTSSPSGLPQISVDFASTDVSGWASVDAHVTDSTTPLAGDPWHWDFSRYDEPFVTTFHFTSMGGQCSLQSIEVTERFKRPAKGKKRQHSVVRWETVAKFAAPAGKRLAPTDKDCGLILQGAVRNGGVPAPGLCGDAFTYEDGPAAPVAVPESAASAAGAR
jgi:hypothetical protein